MSASCVVCGSTNHLYRKVTVDLFRFPSKVLSPEKRAAWIAAVRRVHPGGSLWEPSEDCQICSAHFITGQPSCFRDHPDFVPSVFNYSRALGESAVHSQDPCVERREGEGAALLGETSCSLKVTENISFRCCSCTYVTSYQHWMLRHLVAHGNEQCDYQHPPMSPASRSQVPSNTREHNSEKVFKCKVCPRVFAKNRQLTVHNRTHSGKRPFKCKLCPQAFFENYRLIRHNRIHTDKKPFKCKLCPQVFAKKCQLTVHNRTHSGKKPFKCKLCP
ncbi:zinc finger protein 136-like [Ixodes scapularis]|uniref:zinc finger protein 136-like n=1 Tax=Ixodes scapularis TaxID=6945 RepID=UPI001A9F0951|nr:zinc finger protein 136-like [Ixodes scapularis]